MLTPDGVRQDAWGSVTYRQFLTHFDPPLDVIVSFYECPDLTIVYYNSYIEYKPMQIHGYHLTYDGYDMHKISHQQLQ